MTDRIDVTDQLRFFLKDRVVRILRQISCKISEHYQEIEVVIFGSEFIDEGSAVFFRELLKFGKHTVVYQSAISCQNITTITYYKHYQEISGLVNRKRKLNFREVEALIAAADKFVRFGDAWTGEKIAKRILKDYKDLAKAWKIAGFCANMLGKTVEAELCFKKWREYGELKETAKSNYVMSMLYLRHHPPYLRNESIASGLLDEAFKVLSENEVHDERSKVERIFNRNGYALVLFKKGDLNGATNILKAGIEKLSDDRDGIEKMHKTVLIYNLAQCYLAANEVNLAIDTYKELIKLDSNYPEYRIELARVLIDNHMIHEARLELQEVMDIDQTYPESFNLLGLCDYAEGKIQNDYFGKSHALSPSSPTFAYNFALSLYERGLIDRAQMILECLDFEEATAENMINIASLKAEIFATLQQFDQARQVINDVIECVPPSAELEYNRTLLSKFFPPEA
ncbi:tetratricopeptide repeat protein [Methylobacterium sp. JK268]